VGKRRLDLSPEARDLIVNRGWEHVELQDGPAAQAMIDGVRARPSRIYRAAEPEPEDVVDPDQIGLFDG
jgi:hypothetical protein